MNPYQSLRSSIFVLALIPCIAIAAGGALEINQDCAAAGSCFKNSGAGLPGDLISISAPGAYVLTSDLLVSTPDGVAIYVNPSASPVDIDLNHHTIDGGGTCSGLPVTSCTPGNGNFGIDQFSAIPGTIHLHDGTIRGFTKNPISAAIQLNDAGDGTVMERLNIVENGGAVAISISSESATVGGTVRLRDSQVARNKSAGVQKTGGPTNLTISIENSDLSGNGVWGVVGFTSDTYVGNRFNNNGNFGVNCPSACALGSNSFSGNNSAGLQYSVGTLRDMGGNVCLDHACP
jgi:hypothetical protein